MISFIIPAHNEEHELPATLAAIRAAASGLQQVCEIIVVNDASTDSTPQIVEEAGARIVSINRRQIAAARNAGARAAQGEYLFFVDADTHINQKHVTGAIAALEQGCSGGGARIAIGGAVPLWARVSMKAFCAPYFGLNFAAGAFLFTSRKNFEAVGGFDESLFIGEEVYFSLAVRKLGRFKILRGPIVTSGLKLQIYAPREILGNSFSVIFRGPRAARTRDGLHIWYDGKRETSPVAAATRTRPVARSTFGQ